jgi:hypothetical protein
MPSRASRTCSRRTRLDVKAGLHISSSPRYVARLLIIDVNELDFVKHIDDFAFIVSKVDLELNNLFS